MGTVSDEGGNGVTTNPDGSEVYITGYGNLDGQFYAGNGDIFLVKWASNGNKIWSSLFGSTNLDNGECVTTSFNGSSTYIAGYTYGNIGGQTNAGGADVNLLQVSTGFYCSDIFVYLLIN